MHKGDSSDLVDDHDIDIDIDIDSDRDRDDGRTTTSTSTTAGILRPEQFERYTTLSRHPAGPAAGRWIENYWCLTWDLPPGVERENQVLPHPACTLSVERGQTRPAVGDDPVVVTGVITRRFDVTATGRAWTFAAKFRPGGLAALAGRSAQSWRDRTVPARQVLPADVVDRLRALDHDVPAPECAAVVDAVVAELAERSGADADDRYQLVLEAIAAMLEDRELVRVAQVAARCGLSVRHLQRLFDHYVGVSPKWVLARYRMHDAVSTIDAGYDGPLTDLAASLGWYDQSHFTRDFLSLVGATPGDYRARRGHSNAALSRGQPGYRWRSGSDW